LGLMSPCT
jgi:hypothetical protein